MQEHQNTSIRPVPPRGEPVKRSSTSAISLEQRAILEQRFLNRNIGPVPALASGQANHGPFPLSLAQESLWFIDQFEPESALYNIPHVLRLRGRLDVTALQSSLDWIVNRHDSLRTRFISVDGKPMQEVCHSAGVSLSVIDLSELPEVERQKRARHLIDSESTRSFNLKAGAPFRVGLLKIGADDAVLMLTMHHIVSDLWSFQVFYKELTVAYEAFSKGREPMLPPVRLQFPEYAACQRQRLGSIALQQQLAYWEEQLAGELQILELPVDRSRHANLSFKGRRKKIQMPLSILDGTKEISRKQNTTLFVTLMAAFQTLLNRYSNQQEIIVGSPMSGRTQIETEEMIGMLINTLPIRTSFSNDPDFCEVLERTKRSVLAALAHQEVPVEKVIDDLKISRADARNPLFQTVFQFVPDGAPALQIRGVEIQPLDIELGTSKFELTVTLTESKAGLVGDIEYSTDLFDEGTIDRIITHFETLLRSIIKDPTVKVSRLNILTPEERETVTKTWNQTTTDFPRNATIPHLFEEQVARTPDATAITFEGQKLSYDELNRRANQVAHYLTKIGVGPDSMVGFCVERSVEMVVGLLGILKAGGAYVTLDPALPRERITHMFEDTRAQVFVTTSKFRDLAALGTKTVCLDEAELFLNEEQNNLLHTIAADNLAYVIYTSGSTGKPKGVLVPHRGVIRLVKNTSYLQFRSDDVFLQFATISFDASTLELWGPLLNGGRLVIFPPTFSSVEQLGKVIRENGITTLWLTAGLFHEMVEHRSADLKGVRYLLAGGDVLSGPHVAKALHDLPDTQLINGYGPTENTTFTCCYSVPHHWENGRSVPIGKPISNTEVYIVDAQLQPVPIGVPGELLIGGDGLAREYLNAPELTLQKFVPSPFEVGAVRKLYRTGDRVRWLPDGNIEFLGRFDTQVKIRGFRIELSEVDSALAEHSAVEQCAVVAREDSSKTRQLVAYVVFNKRTAPASAELRDFLGKKLPAYMIPSLFVGVDALPLNSSGKVDRSKLPEPGESLLKKVGAPVANSVEQRIAEIWSEVLGMEISGREENFFELGGHSLLATRVISRVNNAFNCNLPLRVLFESPTLAGLAQAVVQVEKASTGYHPLIRRAHRFRSEKKQFHPEDNA